MREHAVVKTPPASTNRMLTHGGSESTRVRLRPFSRGAPPHLNVENFRRLREHGVVKTPPAWINRMLTHGGSEVLALDYDPFHAMPAPPTRRKSPSPDS